MCAEGLYEKETFPSSKAGTGTQVLPRYEILQSARFAITPQSYQERSCMVRLKRHVKSLARGILGKVESSLTLRITGDNSFVPIFVISLPRSGSTLVYQLLVERFEVCYFDNLMTRFPGAPATLRLLSRWAPASARNESFSSHYGNTRGLRGPAQGYEIWNRWFSSDIDWIDPESLDANKVEEMRATIATLQAIDGAPFINKWQRNTMRVAALRKVFPSAVFFLLERDPGAVAFSILKGRREFLGDENAWLSARPKACSDVEGLTPIEQVSAQVHYLRLELEESLEEAGIDSVFRTSYESVCMHTHDELERFRDYYAQKAGRRLAERGPVPDHFEYRRPDETRHAELAAIRKELAKLGSAYSG